MQKIIKGTKKTFKVEELEKSLSFFEDCLQDIIENPNCYKEGSFSSTQVAISLIEEKIFSFYTKRADDYKSMIYNLILLLCDERFTELDNKDFIDFLFQEAHISEQDYEEIMSLDLD